MRNVWWVVMVQNVCAKRGTLETVKSVITNKKKTTPSRRDVLTGKFWSRIIMTVLFLKAGLENFSNLHAVVMLIFQPKTDRCWPLDLYQIEGRSVFSDGLRLGKWGSIGQCHEMGQRKRKNLRKYGRKNHGGVWKPWKGCSSKVN